MSGYLEASAVGSYDDDDDDWWFGEYQQTFRLKKEGFHISWLFQWEMKGLSACQSYSGSVSVLYGSPVCYSVGLWVMPPSASSPLSFFEKWRQISWVVVGGGSENKGSFVSMRKLYYGR